MQNYLFCFLCTLSILAHAQIGDVVPAPMDLILPLRVFLTEKLIRSSITLKL
jgi:hypothetical protein